MGNGLVFAVAGSKGGVGKTTTSINLSAVLAEMGYGVVLVEADLAMANVGDFLDIDVGLEGEDPTLHEVLAGTATVVDATYESPCTFDVVPSGASLRGFGDADVGALSNALATLRFAYDVVILDTGAGVAPETLVPLALADETILVSSPRVASVRDTMKTRDLTRQVGGSVAGVVFVRSGTGRSPGVDHIAEFLSVELLGHVPEDSAVPDAQDVGMPVAVANRDSEAATAYRELGDRVTELVDGFNRYRGDVLSTDSIGDDSGFSFIDDADETTDDAESSDDVSEAGAEQVASQHRTANGRADGGSARSDARLRTGGTEPTTRPDRSHDDGNAGDADVAKAVQHVDATAGDAESTDTDRTEETKRPRSDTDERNEPADDVEAESVSGAEARSAVDTAESTERPDAEVRSEHGGTGSEPVATAGGNESAETVVDSEPDGERIEPSGFEADEDDGAGSVNDEGEVELDNDEEEVELNGDDEEDAELDDESKPTNAPRTPATEAPATETGETGETGETNDFDFDAAPHGVAADTNGRTRTDTTSGVAADSGEKAGDTDESERDGAEGSESTRTAAKRFIHRAVGIVDRGDD